VPLRSATTQCHYAVPLRSAYEVPLRSAYAVPTKCPRLVFRALRRFRSFLAAPVAVLTGSELTGSDLASCRTVVTASIGTGGKFCFVFIGLTLNEEIDVLLTEFGVEKTDGFNPPTCLLPNNPPNPTHATQTTNATTPIIAAIMGPFIFLHR